MSMKPVVLLLLMLSGCTATGNDRAGHPTATDHPELRSVVGVGNGAKGSSPEPSATDTTVQPVAWQKDGVCTGQEGPNRLITLRADNRGPDRGPDLDLYDGGPLGITAALPTGGFRSLAVDAPKVLTLDEVPSPGNRYKFLHLVGPGLAHLTAISESGQPFQLDLNVHC